jgi:hypothetical protein
MCSVEYRPWGELGDGSPQPSQLPRPPVPSRAPGLSWPLFRGGRALVSEALIETSSKRTGICNGLGDAHYLDRTVVCNGVCSRPNPWE